MNLTAFAILSPDRPMGCFCFGAGALRFSKGTRSQTNYQLLLVLTWEMRAVPREVWSVQGTLGAYSTPLQVLFFTFITALLGYNSYVTLLPSYKASL